MQILRWGFWVLFVVALAIKLAPILWSSAKIGSRKGGTAVGVFPVWVLSVYRACPDAVSGRRSQPTGGRLTSSFSP